MFDCCVFSQDSPDQGALYLVRGMLNVVQEYTWELNSGAKMSIYLNAICLLSAMSQVGFVSSNSIVDVMTLLSVIVLTSPSYISLCSQA